jgi:hypothetical protein
MYFQQIRGIKLYNLKVNTNRMTEVVMKRWTNEIGVFAARNKKLLKLGALTLVTGSLAIPAFAGGNACTPGGPLPADPTCSSGTPYVYGSCAGWTEKGGYFGCTIIEGCT